jgi:hypothetical protein
MRAAVVLASVALLAAGAAQATTVRSGLYGVVMRGPISPVCVAEQPCTEPARNVALLFSRDGRVIGRTVTDNAGRFRVRLPAGLYAVRRAASQGIDRRLDPNQARIRAGRFSRVDFLIDTGIR